MQSYSLFSNCVSWPSWRIQASLENASDLPRLWRVSHVLICPPLASGISALEFVQGKPWVGEDCFHIITDRQYKLVNNEQLSVAQESLLGIQMGPVSVSSIGQADDSCLVSDCIFKLHYLLQLTVEYCQKFHVELVPDKSCFILCQGDWSQAVIIGNWFLQFVLVS